MAAKYSIAHVTSHPWEAEEDEVNTYVRCAAHELSRRRHSVLILAPSRSQERVRASRRALRAAREHPQSLLEGTAAGTPRVIAVGEVLDVQVPLSLAQASARVRAPRALPIDVARTIEELLSTLELDFVHVHEPFAPSASNAALRPSRALNVGSFHAPTERLLSTLLGRRFVATFFGRLDVRTASFAATAELMQRHFPAEYRILAPAAGADRQPDTDSAGGAKGRAGTSAGAAGDRRAGTGAGRTWDDVAGELERIYAELAARRRNPRGTATLRRRLAGRESIDVDLHMHTDHSPDCATPVEVLLATAREQGLGAIAVTDHNEVSGALEAAAQSEGVKVIVAEEIKTATQGEVIGLFLRERIPRGLGLAETTA